MSVALQVVQTEVYEGERLVAELARDIEALTGVAVRDAAPATGEPTRLSNAAGMVALTSAKACGFAVVDKVGRLLCHDERFERWVGQPTDCVGCERLIRKAGFAGKAIGIVETPDNGVVAVCAVRGAGTQLWPLSPLAASAAAGKGSIVLLAFAPSRSSDLILHAARVCGLTPLEARVAEALIESPSLEVAAAKAGVGRETAKDALSRALRKVGVERPTQLVGRLIDLSCDSIGAAQDDDGELGLELGLTRSETRVARTVADGVTAAQAGAALNLSEQTVKSYRKSAFGKLGVRRTRDLRRIITEGEELARIARASEIAFHEPPPTCQLRIVSAPQDRRIAFIDHGPETGRPIIVGHGYGTGRRVPPPLTAALQQAGYRPISPQRPGFGLTDPARQDFLATTADDLARILDRTGLDTVTVLAREGGCAGALAFDGRHGDRLARGVLLNPRSPRHASVSGATVGDRVSRAMVLNPLLISAFAELMRSRTRSDVLEQTLRRTYAGHVVDRAAVDDPATMSHLIADVQGMMSRTSVGAVAEHRAYADGWTIPERLSVGRWTMAYSQHLWTVEDLAPWASHPDLDLVEIAGAGLLVQFTHPQAIVALLAPTRPA